MGQKRSHLPALRLGFRDGFPLHAPIISLLIFYSFNYSKLVTGLGRLFLPSWYGVLFQSDPEVMGGA